MSIVTIWIHWPLLLEFTQISFHGISGNNVFNYNCQKLSYTLKHVMHMINLRYENSACHFDWNNYQIQNATTQNSLHVRVFSPDWWMKSPIDIYGATFAVNILSVNASNYLINSVLGLIIDVYV